MFLLIIPFSGHVPSIVPVRQVFLGSTVYGLSRTFKFVHVTLLRDTGITSSFPISPFCVLSLLLLLLFIASFLSYETFQN